MTTDTVKSMQWIDERRDDDTVEAPKKSLSPIDEPPKPSGGLTEPQIKAITSTKKKVIVTASAGAGKTFTMVSRVIDFVVNKGVDLTSVVMLTFTNKAAEEMKGRLSSELHKGIADATDPFVKKRLAMAIDVLPLFHCSTIDSFCFKIVKSHFQMLGLSPMLSLLDEDGQERAMGQAARMLLDEIFRNDPDDYHAIMEIFSDKEENIETAVKKVYTYAMTTDAPETFWKKANDIASLPDLRKAPAMQAFFRRVNEGARDALAFIRSFPPFSAGAKVFETERYRMENYLDSCVTARSLADIAEAREKAMRLKKDDKGANDADKVAYGQMRDRFLSVRDGMTDCKYSDAALASDAAVAEKAQKETLTLLRIAYRFQELYQSVKEGERVIDFCDVEHYALRLFSDYGVAKELGCKFLLVDECQDLNPLQDRLMQSIVDGNDLFMVGDVKQSIYRFRLSDPSILQNKIEAGRTDPATDVIDFTSNFRSCDAVVDFVNTVFSRLMTEEFGGVDYPIADRNGVHKGDGEVRMFFYRKEKEEAPPPNGIYSVEAAAKEKAAESARTCPEGEWVRDRIRELVGREYESTDPRVTEKQTVTYGDIAILSARKMTTDNLQARVIETLRRASIPVNVGGFVKDGDHTEINAIVDFLRLIESPMNDYAMLSVLRSDMFAFSLDRLSEISLAEGTSFAEKAIGRRAAGDADLEAFFSYLTRMRELSGVLSLYELVSRLVDDKLRLPLLRRADGRKVFGDVLTYVGELKSMDPMPSISDYLPYFDKYYKMREGGEVAESDAVKVMSVHASKGLESPVVFVIGLDDAIIGRPDQNENVFLDKEYGLVKKPSRENCVYIEQFKNKKERELKEDKLRLLYVALTRARNFLFLSGGVKPEILDAAKDPERVPVSEDGTTENKKSTLPDKTQAATFAEWILGAINGTDYPFVSDNPPCSVAETQVGDLPVEVSVDEAAALEKALSWKYSHEKATETSIKFTVTAINDMEEVELPPTEIRFPVEDKKSKGTAFHAAMENAPFTLEGEEETSRFLDGLVESRVIEASDRADLSPRAVFAALKRVRRLVEGYEVYREKSFLLRLPARAASVADIDDPVLVQGKIDLLAIKGDEAIVLDYKLSGLPSPVLREKYDKQLELYKKAVLAGYPEVKHVIRYIFVLGRNEEILLDP
ncbi:MAG: UvrD-helicase domain-containing protein [Clostridia bacterium]|nr:UvrD-helicase domain-containing protein [Clostridia bacterium]